MLLYGTVQNIVTTSNCEVYNFSSLTERYTRLHLLPPREFGKDYNYQFDLMYAKWIFDNDEIFFDFMMIVYNLYLGKDIFIIVDNDLEQLNESLFKLIQQRYGYEANRINCPEDFLYAEESSFSELGLMNLDQDKDRLAYMLESMRLAQGGQPYV